MTPALRAWLRWSGLFGLVAPAIWFGLLYSNSLSFTSRNILVVLWPSSLMMIATANSEGTTFAYYVITVAVLVNVLLYILTGTAIWAFVRLLSREREIR